MRIDASTPVHWTDGHDAQKALPAAILALPSEARLTRLREMIHPSQKQIPPGEILIQKQRANRLSQPQALIQ